MAIYENACASMPVLFELPCPLQSRPLSRYAVMQIPSAVNRKKALARRVYWILVLVWGVIAVQISDRVADEMKFRINDLSAIAGAGLVMRDSEGTFFHINDRGLARQIYPTLAANEYKEVCLDCVLVTGEQLSQTNQFCASSLRKELPAIEFELPCQTWAVMGDGDNVVTVSLFLLPLLALPLLRTLFRALSDKRWKR